MSKKQFVNANEEFLPLLKQIYLSNLDDAREGKDHLPINVEPNKIICLRLLSGGGKKFAYVRPIRGEYRLLTEARYFMVICNDTFNNLPIERQKYVILHEFCHMFWNEENQEYETIKHDCEDFSYLLKNSNWNTELVKSYKWEQGDMFEGGKKGKV